MTDHLVHLGKKILNEGHWIGNERTGTRCLTIPTHIAHYHPDYVPIDTTRKQAFKAPIMELIGYLRGYTNAQDFADIGAPTWFGNANETQAWLDNPNRKGKDDCGLIYGAVAMNEIEKVFDHLSRGIDDRGEIISFWKPDMFDQGCLRPCLHTHAFQLIEGTLYLTSTQRSADVGLAGSWNAIQCWVLMKLMAQITGYKASTPMHIIHHPHIYEPHYEKFVEQMSRESLPTYNVEVWINPAIKTLKDLQTWVTADDFEIINYKHHEPISYEFIS